jgi:hypothetical protein
VVVAATITLGGCAVALPTIDPVQDRHLRGHYVLAHEDGYSLTLPGLSDDAAGPGAAVGRTELLPPRDTEDIERRILGGIDGHARRLWPDLASARRVPGPSLRLLVFVHGGLNSYDDNFQRMRELVAEPCEAGAASARLFVSQDCASARTDYYPVFINWNSRLDDAIVDDLFFVRFGRRRPAYGMFTWPFVLAARLSESVFNAPNAWLATWRGYWEGRPGAGEIVESAALLPVRTLTTPVLKAFGTSAWQIMRRRAHLVSAERLDAHLNPDGRTGQGMRRGVARTLFEMLDGRIEPCGESGGACWKVSGEPGLGGPVEITLVAHSMGAIVVNRLLVMHRRLPVRRIVYLSPAASIEEIEGMVRPYLDHPPATGVSWRPEFWTFTLTRHDEALERTLLTALLPRGTLLRWTDNLFEPVGQPGDNRFGRFQSHIGHYGRVPRAPATAKFNVCRWADGAEPRPTTHAAIDNSPFLEGVLYAVGADAFRLSGDAPSIDVRCRLE